ncbi:hypothetical protein COCC4DRAFT_49509 [Bipolaris maydis ATCC 48331]|uniref:Gfd2/YDR514C-like C-terminal domain-containing protein n=1 Tax=Cochliobolus heterostrophus (strain C4 / ATCC 48331 / race T) TaxID=665024 RepID=N4XP36_COCH4|nr:uncharacterized protein COCC4DRAFT_49509 [Bipolaris maydis ATCC 48331]ENI06892.1 hypothetical protein COCC4DRAFT_49509 [Bipolaris maydis ATCC 48331]KAJ5056207.1 hypothetical protein J3E74DRAFT_421956 [Bipolaris maydis]KAJ6211914.1 hypothetical protein PSV09DRAFT_2431136 [Bipolaris maydis]KAJ6267158.1 hypothetical protein PSV08DRAFT_412121 [Bipolaris maydis]
MVSEERLEKLRGLTKSAVDALPDRRISPDRMFDDSDSSGGVLLEPHLLDMPLPQQDVKHPPTTNLRRGELASAHDHFTPIQALAKYPYTYCDKSHMQPIASAIFDQGKFWNRVWDIYYVWPTDSSKPTLVVHENQVQALLTEINHQLQLDLRITNHQREEGLVIRFPDHPRCLPRYLGRSQSRQDIEDMITITPNETYRAVGEPPHPILQPAELEAFNKLMEDIAKVQKPKGKAKAKRQQDRLAKNKTMASQFKRAQRHLGLREAEQMHPSAEPRSSPAVDSSMPAPFMFEQSVVFVCVDVESYEGAHHKITEVGVATLDTRDLQGVAPGENGKAWREMIRARHFRIKEYKHLVNHLYVIGHPDGFLFGKSTLISLNEAANHVAACFRAPFGGVDTPTEQSNEKRNIILLGHDTLGDVHYLQQLGYDPVKEGNILEVMDTATMYRVWHRDQQPTKLGNILGDFDIVGWKLHNAGNDAVYTLQAMLGICVREATSRGSLDSEEMLEINQTAESHRSPPVPHAADLTKLTQLEQAAVPQYDGSSDIGIYSEQEHGHVRGVVDISRREDNCCASSGDYSSSEREVYNGSWHCQTKHAGLAMEATHAQEQGHWQDLLDVSANMASSENIPNVQYYW